MRTVYIITGGILAIVAVVFLTHNSKNDATDSVQQAETNSQEPPNHRWRHPEVIALEKTEMRKYGRLLTDEERSTQWWREQDEAEERAAYAQLYEERKDWIDNFPFRRGYHSDIVYDPENNIAHSDVKYRAYEKELERKSDEAMERYDAEVDKLWARTDLTTEEKYAEDAKLFSAVELADQRYHTGDPEIEEHRRIIMRHKQLEGFYKQAYRYAPEFEQAYRIFEEEGAGDNPVRIADTMTALENYFVNRRQASQHGLDELHPVQTRWDPKTKQRRRITWEEELESDFRCIAGNMDYKPYLLPGEPPLTEEQINRIRDRLIAEIPPDGFTGNTFLFGLMDPKDEDMIPGQSLLAE